ncbi:MAG: AAA family ATPase [Nanoarchaeota archaeon]|nr:AAA family ATPase [Nanoarchaeota archaeon]MCA9495711.1 AAA family ATPase [Nanoarchaeota archaeon]
MSIPQIAALKDIPVGFKYYIPFSSENLRIESGGVVDTVTKRPGFRIWVNLNAKASIRSYSVFTLPVIKKKGKLVVRFEFYEESYDVLLNFLINNWENEKLHTSLSEVRNELNKKVPETEFALFYSKNFSSYVERSVHTLQQSFGENPNEIQLAKFQELRKIAEQSLLNFKEEELLSMQDFSQITFKTKQISAGDLTKIMRYLENVGLSQEQESKIYSYLEINRLIDGLPLQKEGKHGVLLYGPPGTGKTTTMRAFFSVFELLGCSVFEVNAQSLTSSPYVGAFAAEISKQIFEPAIEKVIKNRMPCLVYVDEATNLVSKPSGGNVADWYQEGLDTLKNYMNRSKFPGIILCLATNARFGNLDETIVGDNGRLEAVYFDFPNENQFVIIWRDKLERNLGLDKQVVETWEREGGLGSLAKICANSISGRRVANFCSKYREIFLSDKSLTGFLGIKLRRDTGRNLIKENESKEIIFGDFYLNFLEDIKLGVVEEEKEGVDEVKNNHYMSLEERDSKIDEIRSKYANKLREIESELERLKRERSSGVVDRSSGGSENGGLESGERRGQNNDSVNTLIEGIEKSFVYLRSNLLTLKRSGDKDLLSYYRKYLFFIYENLEDYRELKSLSKLDYNKLGDGFKACFQILEKYLRMDAEVVLDQREYEVIERFVQNLFTKQNS